MKKMNLEEGEYESVVMVLALDSHFTEAVV